MGIDVLVIGAGLSGLVAAYRAKRAGLAVAVFEARPRPGGVIGSERRAGALFERGPNSGLDTTPLINAMLDRPGNRRRACRRQQGIVQAVCGPRRSADRAAHVARRVPEHAALFVRREGSSVRRTVHRQVAAGGRGVDRPVRSPAARARIPRLRDRALRRGHLRGRSRDLVGAGRLPAAARARTALWRADQGRHHGRAGTPEERGQVEERRVELFVPRRHADAHGCAGARHRQCRLRGQRPARGTTPGWVVRRGGRTVRDGVRAGRQCSRDRDSGVRRSGDRPRSGAGRR